MTELTTRRKIAKTICLICVWVCIGMNLEITGPTLIDLKIITGTSYEVVARAASGRGFGFFIGALIGGFLVEKLDAFCDLIVGICVSLMGVFGILITYVDTTWMFVIILLQGVYEGVVNVAGQKLLLEIWQEKAASPMHSLHLGFGIGSLVVPQIANPFLAVLNFDYHDIPDNNSTFNNDSNSLLPFNKSLENSTLHNKSQDVDHDEFLVETHVKWAYLIVASIACAVSTVFFVFQFCGKSYRNVKVDATSSQDPKPSPLAMIDPGSCAGGDRAYGMKILVFLFLFSFQAFGGEYVCSNFLRTYTVDHHHMAGDDASILNTCFWISYTLGCFLGFLAAAWIPIRRLLLLQSFGFLISTILMVLLVGRSQTLLWIFILPVGALIAPAFPVCLVWGDRHIEMTGMALTFVLFGGSSGGVTYLWVAGHVYDSFGPETFPYMCVFCGAVLCLFAVLLHAVSWKRGTRFKESMLNIAQQDDQINAEKLYMSLEDKDKE